MKTATYRVKLIGESPLLLHKDSVTGSMLIKKWQKNPENKKNAIAGDDRCPAWTWLTYCYHDNNFLQVDVDNIMSMLRDAGKRCPNPSGRGSLKVQTQSGIIAEGLGWNIKINGKEIPWQPLEELYKVENFEVHQEVAEKLGIELFIKRAKIGKNKHIRVRPRISNWTLEGKITVLDESLTENVIQTILRQGGFYVGLGDWRPGSPMSPGQFGRFSVNVSKA